MRRQSIRVPAIAAFTLLFALDCLTASAFAHAKTHPAHKRPHHQIHPARVHLIRCAAMFGTSPCWPDPSMMRLGRPGESIHGSPEPPQFGPSR